MYWSVEGDVTLAMFWLVEGDVLLDGGGNWKYRRAADIACVDVDICAMVVNGRLCY